MSNATTTGLESSAAIVIAAALVCASLAIALRRARSTTLVAPLLWGLLAVAVVAGVELLGNGGKGGEAPRWLGAARYVAGMATFCPLIAVLGAKRPQDRAWQLIVVALWFVLSLPALQDVIYHYGRPVSVDSAWRWFLLVLIVAGLVNYLPTRYWPSSALFAAAQMLLLIDYLPLGVNWPFDPAARIPVALALFAGASLLPVLGWPRARRASEATQRLWRDFRDAYGMLWAVRIGERAGAAPHVASDTLTPARPAETTEPSRGVSAPGSDSRQLEQTLIAHLQRFVSRAWIDERLAR